MKKNIIGLLSIAALCSQLTMVSLAEQPFNPLTESSVYAGESATSTTAMTTTSTTAMTTTTTTESDAASMDTTTTSTTTDDTKITYGKKKNKREVPVAQEVVTFPLRFITGSLGLAVGTITGGVKGMATQPKKFSEATLDKGDEKPWLIPVGLVGLPISVPYGFLQGFPGGATTTASDWYHLWD